MARRPEEKRRKAAQESSEADSEFSRMERMLRGLLKVPKKAINGQGGKVKKKA